MSKHATAAVAPVSSLAAPSTRRERATRPANDPSGGFAALATLGAGFAGFVSYDRNHDVLLTAMAFGVTFVGAWLGLHVLYVVYRLTVAVGKVALPVGAVLLLGCALDWPWAERAAHWLRAAGSRGIELAEHGFAALRAK